MKSQSILLIALSFVVLTGCRESRSPTDPAGSQPTFPSSYSLSGQVVSGVDRAALPGTQVSIDGVKLAVTNNEGNYQITGITRGLHAVSASREGFIQALTSVLMDGVSPEIRHDFVLGRDTGGLIPQYQVAGVTWVSGSEGHSAYVGARVEVVDGPQAGLSEESDEMGFYSLRGLIAGTVRVRASQSGRSETKTIELGGSQLFVHVDFSF
jgi:hypothetical protein